MPPAMTLRFDASAAPPFGHTVTKLGADTLVAVTLSTTAVAARRHTSAPGHRSVTGSPGRRLCGAPEPFAGVEQPGGHRADLRPFVAEVAEHVGDQMDRVARGTEAHLPPSPSLQITRLGTS